MRVRNQCAPFAAALLCIVLAAGRAEAQGDAVAMVNGEPVGAAEFYDRVQRINVRDFIVTATPLTFRQNSAGQLVLDQMINERLTIQWASKANLMPPETEVEAELTRAKAQPQVKQALAAHQLTEEGMKQNIRLGKARFNLATTGTTVTPEEVEKYYKDHLAAYTTPERYALEGFNTDKQSDLAKIQADIKAARPFPEMVKTYSTDHRLTESKGVMGVFSANDQSMPPAIHEAAAAMKEGQISPAIKVESDAGPGKPKVVNWWFLHMVRRLQASTPPFGVVQKQAEQSALLEKAGGMKVADKKIDDFRQLSEIKINLPGYEMLLPKPAK